MKGIKKYIIFAFIVGILFYDLIVLLIRKDYNSTTFWIAFGFTNFSFITVILGTLLTGEKTGERGVQPITTILMVFCGVTVLVGILMYGLSGYIDKLERFSVWASLPFIFITGVFSIFFAFSLMNGHVIRSQSQPKPMMFNEDDVTVILSDIERLATDETVKTQIKELIALASECKPSEDSEVKRLDQSIREYIQFLHKNVTRKEMGNVYNNIKKINALLRERLNIK